MPRSRTISPKFFRNEDLGSLPEAARLCFIGLWCLADRSGRLEDRPRRIQAELFPYGCPMEAETMLAMLDEKDLILRYRINDDDFIQIPKWFTYQHPHPREDDSGIPPIPCDLTDIKGCRAFSRLSKTKALPSRAFPSIPSIPSIPSVSSDTSATGTPVADGSEPSPRVKKRAQIPDEVGRWFEVEFWPIYWRRVDKAAALKEFRRHATTAERKDMIVAAVRKQRAYYSAREPDKQPYASTWLHKERYNDDPELLSTGGQPNRNGGPPRTFGELRQQRQQEIFEDLLERELEKHAVLPR